MAFDWHGYWSVKAFGGQIWRLCCTPLITSQHRSKLHSHFLALVMLNNTYFYGNWDWLGSSSQGFCDNWPSSWVVTSGLLEVAHLGCRCKMYTAEMSNPLCRIISYLFVLISTDLSSACVVLSCSHCFILVLLSCVLWVFVESTFFQNGVDHHPTTKNSDRTYTWGYIASLLDAGKDIMSKYMHRDLQGARIDHVYADIKLGQCLCHHTTALMQQIYSPTQRYICLSSILSTWQMILN